jgi:DNA-binding MarR family transcriptional regulator
MQCIRNALKIAELAAGNSRGSRPYPILNYTNVHDRQEDPGLNTPRFRAARTPTSLKKLNIASEFHEDPIDERLLPAYTCNMNSERHNWASSPCFCNVLRQASRAVSRLYDEELRSVGLRTTQLSLLHVLGRAGPVRQGDLGDLIHLEETTVTRNLRPLVAAGWVSVRSGDDRREKIVTITDAGTAKLREARPAWERAQARMRALLPEVTRQGLLTLLPEVARLTAKA